jgi:phenylacetic acid degradation operon negative regulatory protein
LRWSGFGAVANGVFAHPGKDGSEVLQITSERDLEGKVMVFSATAHDAENMLKVQRSLVDAGWPLGELAQRYSEFIREFAPLEKQLGKGASIEPAEAYQLRILVLHQYRRILLRDPTLPVRLLPTAWPGLRAYELCKNIYKNVYADAEQYLDESAACPDGRLPKPGAPFFRRFGGLRK